MKENRDVEVVFEGLVGCPVINMSLEAWRKLDDDCLINNNKRSMDFDEVASHIRFLPGVYDSSYNNFSDFWFNNHTSWYYWPKGKMGVTMHKEHHKDYISICGLIKKGDFDTELANRQMKDLMNGPYGILTSIADRHCNLVHIKDVIFNDPATIVFWSDGTKTVCTCSEQDTYDPEKGLALCVMKRVLYNNKGHIFNNAREKWLKKGNKR